MTMFPKIATILPEGSKGIARVEHCIVSKRDAMLESLRGNYLSPGKLCRLFVGRQMMMSDGDNEHRTNYEVVRQAHGEVLIAGLGIGLILTLILKKNEVQRVTVIEKYQDVIDLVAPHYQHKKLEIICADIYEWKPAKGSKYDCIYFDVWADQSTDDLEDMARLHQRFKGHKRAGGWMDSWRRDWLKYRKRQEARSGW